MLRPGEVDRLRVRDFCFPEDVELAEGVGLVIEIHHQAKQELEEFGPVSFLLFVWIG